MPASATSKPRTARKNAIGPRKSGVAAPRARVFVTARKKQYPNVNLSEHEWLLIESSFNRSKNKTPPLKPGKNKINGELRADILDVTNLFLSSTVLFDEGTILISEARELLTGWRKSTIHVGNSIWKGPRTKVKKARKGRGWEERASRALTLYLSGPLLAHERAHPLAYLDRVLRGAMAVSRIISHELGAAAISNTKGWFLWIGLVLALLRRADLPVVGIRKNSI